MRTLSKPLLVVTQKATSQIVPTKKNAVQIVDINRIFPSIHEMQPTGIVLDYDFLGTETEKILRRIISNPFYGKIKIYCYKSRPHTKVDGLLAVLGVKQFIYADTVKKSKGHLPGKLYNYVLNTVAVHKLIDAN